MTPKLKIQFLSIFLSLAAWSAHAQAASKVDDLSNQSTAEEETAAVNEVRWYQVELLIFKQRPLSSDIQEVWPKNITLNYPENWDTLKSPEQYQQLYQKNVAPNTPFILLDKKQFQFSAIEKKLQINRNDILFHGAWRQSLTQNLDQNENTPGTPILIRGGDRFDDHYELEGSISLKLSRYLHVNTDLWLTRFAPASQKVTIPETAVKAEDKTAEPAVTAWPALPSYPFIVTPAVQTDAPATTENNLPPVSHYQVDEIATNKQTRRMRSYETHYIDHPKFGILVRFTPVDQNSMLPIPQKNK